MTPSTEPGAAGGATAPSPTREPEPARPTSERSPRILIALGAVVLAAALALGGLYSLGYIPRAPEPSPITVTVDTSVHPIEQRLPDRPDGTPRPLAALADAEGRHTDFVEDEIILATDDAAALNALVGRWHGTVLSTVDPKQHHLSGPAINVIRIDPAAVDPSSLSQDLRSINTNATGAYRVSSEAGLKTLAAAAHEAAGGAMGAVGVDFVMPGADFRSRVSTEHPSGPSDWTSYAYSTNAFTWPHMSSGSQQNTGVAEAWRALQMTGRISNRVTVAVLDSGMTGNANLPPGGTWIGPVGSPGAGTCVGPSGSASCPYHGTETVDTAMGLADNGWGGAGPAGPVARPLLIDFPDISNADQLIQSVVTAADFAANYATGNAAAPAIVSMSFGTAFLAFFSWLVYPVDLITRSARAAGMLLFASAGNELIDVDASDCIYWPWGPSCWEKLWWTPCENGGVICVGALAFDSPAADWSYTNYGGKATSDPDSVDIWGPGTVWVSPNPQDGSLHTTSGTSIAAPFVAGVAALIWAANPAQSADQVENCLMSTAFHPAETAVVRSVNAYGAVACALGSRPPELSISYPADGSRVSYPVNHLDAATFDPDGGAVTVTWRDQSGTLLGTGNPLVSFPAYGLGLHSLSATSRDASGVSVTATSTFTIVNDPPTVNIVSPMWGANYYSGESFSLRATSFDPNILPGNRLADASMVWTDSVQGSLGTGHTLTTSLSALGWHSITLRGTDPQGAFGEDILQVYIGPVPPNLPPTAYIDSICTTDGTDCDLDYSYTGYDGAQWYADLVFTGHGTDPEGGPVTLLWIDQWTASDGTVLTTNLGTGSPLTARIYSDRCMGATHTIFLRVTDNVGNWRDAERSAFIYELC